MKLSLLLTVLLMANHVYAADFTVLIGDKKQILTPTVCGYEKSVQTSFAVVDLSNQKEKLILADEDGEKLGVFKSDTLVRILEPNSILDKQKIEIIYKLTSGSIKNESSSLFKLLLSKTEESVEAGDVGFVDKLLIKPLSNYALKIHSLKDPAVEGKVFVPFNNNKVTLKCDKGISQNEVELFVDTTAASPTFLALNGVSKLVFENADLVPVNTLDSASLTLRKDAEEYIKTKLGVKTDIPKIDDTKIPVKNGGTDQLPQVQNGVDLIVCTPNKFVNVRDEALTNIVFTAKNEEKVKIRQNFDNKVVEGMVDGKNYKFYQVEFETKVGESARVGYLATSLVKPKSDCQYAAFDYNLLTEKITNFDGLSDTKCCTFPTLSNVLVEFTTGQRQFGYSRSGGARAHAANDLYRHINDNVRSIAPGIVIRPLYKFYEGTYALEIINGGGSVARYGEITGTVAEGTNYGEVVTTGQRIGLIGKVNSGCCSPMLHFELYSGKARGPLTQAGVAINGIMYNRRSDLISPTEYLLKWQNETFNK